MLGLSKSTAVYCCHGFVREICRVQKRFIKFPTTQAEVHAKIEEFSKKSAIPNVVGANDGTNIAMKAPMLNHEEYFNRKHYYSIIAQGIVDAKGVLLSVSTGFPGSLHDTRVLTLSEIFRPGEDKLILTQPTIDLNGTTVGPLIVGDSAYPLKTWLLRPFQNNGALSREKRHFNKELSKCRIVAEHAFGQTKARWRILGKRVDEETERTPDTTIACCVLHNICVLMNEDPVEENEGDGDEDETFGEVDARAQLIRDSIVEYLAHH